MIAAIVASASAHADDAPRDVRVTYIAGLIEALRATDMTTIANTSRYIASIESNKCRAAEQSLRVGCLVEAVAASCKQGDAAQRERCQRLSDVIVTNRLGESVFLPKDVRYKLMNDHRDYKTAFARELRAQYAVRASEFVMSRHFPGSNGTTEAIAAGIDAHCRDVAGMRDLSWQYCVAAIVWFSGTAGRAP